MLLYDHMKTRPRRAEVPKLHAVGAALRERRQAMGLAQDELAELCGLHRTYIGSVERGERNVTLLGLIRISEAVQLTASQLLQRARL